MSVFYCDSCDQLVDSDEAPDFTYNEETGKWKCESCNENLLIDLLMQTGE